MMKSGIYKIICLKTGKIYIGKSVNIEVRFRKHRYDLKIGKHGNPYIQRSFNKYGIENFKMEIIERCSKEFLFDREYFWITKFKSYDEKIGFNILKEKDYGKSMIERWDDPSYKKKMSEKHKKRWEDPEFREKNLKGIRKHHKKQFEKYGDYAFNTEEAKEKSKETCSTEEYKKKKSEIRLKELSTEEGKKKNEELLKKARSSPLRKKNLLEHNKRLANDKEFQKKSSERQKNLWKDPEHREMRIKAIKEALNRKKNNA